MTTTPNPWAVGWAGFAGIMLIMIGAFHVVAGLIAVANDTFYVVGPEYIFQFDVTTWGWVHLVGGGLVVLSGFGIFSGNVAARTVGVVVAALSALVNFAWLPYAPLWSSIMIAIAVAVIWALTVHGRDVTL